MAAGGGCVSAGLEVVGLADPAGPFTRRGPEHPIGILQQYSHKWCGPQPHLQRPAPGSQGESRVSILRSVTKVYTFQIAKPFNGTDGNLKLNREWAPTRIPSSASSVLSTNSEWGTFNNEHSTLNVQGGVVWLRQSRAESAEAAARYNGNPARKGFRASLSEDANCWSCAACCLPCRAP